MSNFETLFGLKENQLKSTCVLTPFFTKGMLDSFKTNELFKGNPYSCANSDNLTLIKTHVGAPFVGDAVLNLKNTYCSNIILFGSCGLVAETEILKIGSIVSPTRALELESFSQLLNCKIDNCSFSQADTELLEKLINISSANIETIQCASIGSISLENEYKEFFLENNISALDMECSAFFNAAKHINRKAIALFYATDILGTNDPFDKPSEEHKTAIDTSIDLAIKTIQVLANNLG
ncbi:MAG: hypothetical protein KKD07_01920 [Candidatus Omnitrophica bacterium]|nr:hypothetical protein [Candidatus Omnitrophota bacterium]MBU1996912.1 hypothetical protein [Candidatus Omnitrophota bacterium]MBU4333178.1 hypothetical protein [Candidatus Omnitrophota bacterium]